jgi:hypothetical protein
MIAYTLTNNTITVVLNNKVYTVDNTQPQWNNVLEAIRNEDEDKLQKVLSVASAITSFTEGNITVKDNQVFYKNTKLDNYVVDKVLEFASNNLPLKPLLKFIDKLMKNPSRTAVQELYKFLEHKNMPITPDGNFLAYKGVRTDYFSKTAGKIEVLKGRVVEGRIYNGVGEDIEVERNLVCDNSNIACSTGLHAGSLAYATSFGVGGKVVIVEINPTNVVSVPTDANNQKLRACAYKVISEYEMPLNNNYTSEFGSGFEEDDFNENDELVDDDFFGDDDFTSDEFSKPYDSNEHDQEQYNTAFINEFNKLFRFTPSGPSVKLEKSEIPQPQNLKELLNQVTNILNKKINNEQK